jgi:uncharacterized protein (DUF58 family)
MADRRPKAPLLRRWLTARGRSLEITKSGWLFLLLTLAVGFVAINSGSNLLHAVFGAQMALVIGSGLLSERMVRRSQALRMPGSELHAGTPGALRVELRNVDRRSDVFSISVEDDDLARGAGACRPVYSVRVPAGTTTTHHTTVTLPRRGWARLPPAVIATRFPFGLFVKRRMLPASPNVLVYPRLHEVSLTHDTGGMHQLTQDGALEESGRPGRAGEFFCLREYREGDELRWIHWPAFARRGRPIVREHEAEREHEVVLRLPVGRTGTESFEREVEDVASLAIELLARGQIAVGLAYGDDLKIDPGMGSDQRRRVLEFLALVGETS